MLYAKIRPDGIELHRDPEDTDGMLPVEEVEPILAEGQVRGPHVLINEGDKVVMSYEAIYPPPAEEAGNMIDNPEVRAAIANATTIEDIKNALLGL